MAVAGTTSWIVAMPPSRTLSAYHILFVHSLSLAHLTVRGLLSPSSTSSFFVLLAPDVSE